LEVSNSLFNNSQVDCEGSKLKVFIQASSNLPKKMEFFIQILIK
jgi:hypothetical protein